MESDGSRRELPQTRTPWQPQYLQQTLMPPGDGLSEILCLVSIGHRNIAGLGPGCG